MKILKILSVTIFLATLMVAPLNAGSRDCSAYSKFSHKWNMCKIGKLRTVGGETKLDASGEKKIKKKGLLWKLKTMGGATSGDDS